ncbi:hypothetical protein [Kitasatospora sp. NPDC006786]|uniref:hypothetical protein n=1 Tax=unclassified Kitasatospora TaxID=2633591 RepID=UPI0033FEC29E
MKLTSVVSARALGQVISGMRWLSRRTGDPTVTWEAWAKGEAAPVPVGSGFVVVRLPGDLGADAVAELAATVPQLLGPVLVNHSAVEVFLPIAPAVWLGPDAELIDGRNASERAIKCPPAGREADRRRWQVLPRALPGTDPVLTDPYRLAAALDQARARRCPAGA